MSAFRRPLGPRRSGSRCQERAEEPRIKRPRRGHEVAEHELERATYVVAAGEPRRGVLEHGRPGEGCLHEQADGNLRGEASSPRPIVRFECTPTARPPAAPPPAAKEA